VLQNANSIARRIMPVTHRWRPLPVEDMLHVGRATGDVKPVTFVLPENLRPDAGAFCPPSRDGD